MFCDKDLFNVMPNDYENPRNFSYSFILIPRNFHGL